MEHLSAVNFMGVVSHLTPAFILRSLLYSRLHPSFSLLFPFSCLPPTECPGAEDSPLGGPRVVVNGNGSLNGQVVGSGGVVVGVEQGPEGQQFSPLTSPLLTEAGYVRNEDEDEARRKVSSSQLTRPAISQKR